MIPVFIYRFTILAFGTLYPSYSSYKAIKNKDVREYSRWMMYWVCFGIFSAGEVFTDILLSFWFPFYYELKILFILWLMSPYGNGARVMYKNIIHPELNRREPVIDSYIETAKAFGLESIMKLYKKSTELINVGVYYIVQASQMAVVRQLQLNTNPYQALIGQSTDENRNDLNLFQDTSIYSSPSNTKSTDSLDLLGLNTEIMELENEEPLIEPTKKKPKTKEVKENGKTRVKRTKKQIDEAGDAIDDEKEKVVRRTQRKAALKAKLVYESETD